MIYVNNIIQESFIPFHPQISCCFFSSVSVITCAIIVVTTVGGLKGKASKLHIYAPNS